MRIIYGNSFLFQNSSYIIYSVSSNENILNYTNIWNETDCEARYCLKAISTQVRLFYNAIMKKCYLFEHCFYYSKSCTSQK